MLSTAGTPLAEIAARVQSILGEQSRLLVPGKNQSNQNILSAAEKPQGGFDDLVDLSEDALRQLDESRKVLESLEDGQAELIRKEIEFAFKRLEQVREQIKIAGSLLSKAGPDQAEALRGSIEDIGSTLDSVANQIDFSISRTQQSVSVELVQGQFSSEFNALASQAAGGDFAAYRESLNVEFSFLKVSFSEETLSVTKDEDGVSVEKTTQQTDLVVAQDSVSQEQTLVVGENGGGYADLVSELGAVTQEFTNLAAQFLEKFGIDKPFPQPFLDLLRELSEIVGDGNTKPVIDQSV